MNSILSAGSVSPASATIDNGQSLTLSASPSGGLAPYTYQGVHRRIVRQRHTRSQLPYLCGEPPGEHDLLFRRRGFFEYALLFEIVSNVLVNPALAAAPTSVSNATLLYGDARTIRARVSGGTAPYTYNFLVYDPSGSLVDSATSVSSSASNVLTIQQSSAWGTGTQGQRRSDGRCVLSFSGIQHADVCRPGAS